MKFRLKILFLSLVTLHLAAEIPSIADDRIGSSDAGVLVKALGHKKNGDQIA